jgi:hypothetical protein
MRSERRHSHSGLSNMRLKLPAPRFLELSSMCGRSSSAPQLMRGPFAGAESIMRTLVRTRSLSAWVNGIVAGYPSAVSFT